MNKSKIYFYIFLHFLVKFCRLKENSDPRRFYQSIWIKTLRRKKHEPTNHEITERLRFCLLNWQETNFIQFYLNRTDKQYHIKIMPERTSPLVKIKWENNHYLTIFWIYFPFAVKIWFRQKPGDPLAHLKTSILVWRSVVSESNRLRNPPLRPRPRPLNPDHYFGNTRLIGILLLTNRSFHLVLCSIPGQIIGTSVYFFLFTSPVLFGHSLFHRIRQNGLLWFCPNQNRCLYKWNILFRAS